MTVWMSVQHLVNLGSILAELFYSLTGQTRSRVTFVQYLIAFCSRQELMSDIISVRFVEPVVADNCVKFGDHRLNHSREIPPEAA